MLYNATINVNPNEYPDEDAMVDDIMTDLEGYHPSISDSTDFPGTIDVVVAIKLTERSHSKSRNPDRQNQPPQKKGGKNGPDTCWALCLKPVQSCSSSHTIWLTHL